MYTLTRNCSLGDLDNCGCDVSRNGKIGEHQSKITKQSIASYDDNTQLILNVSFSELLTFSSKEFLIRVMFCVQVVVAGCGVAAVIMWISGRGFPNSMWMHRRQARTPGLLSTYTTTRQDDRYIITLQSLLYNIREFGVAGNNELSLISRRQ